MVNSVYSEVDTEQFDSSCECELAFLLNCCLVHPNLNLTCTASVGNLLRCMKQILSFNIFKSLLKMGDVLKPKVIFVLGGPGAGKGTQCSNIVKEFGFVHLSAGDLLREERSKPGTEYGELIEEHIRNGQIVPVEITCKLLELAMLKSEKQKFLIDGFPRNQDNLEGWTREMSEKVELLFVLFFDCSQDTCVKRCLKRGAEGSGRSDDNEESLKKRIQTFVNDSMPIIDYYKERNLVHRINANQNAEEVFEAVKKIFQENPSLNK